MIRAVISDLMGVLTTSPRDGWSRVQARTGLSLEVLLPAMKRFEARLGENPLFPLERGEITEHDFFRQLGADVSVVAGREIDLGRFTEHYFAALAPNDEFIDWLTGARARHGLPMALLTNNVREWEPYWRAMLPVDELFEVVVDSAFVGMRKPDRAIYELTLARLGLPAGECAFVDDMAPNVEAAAAVGLHAILFEDAEQAIGELERLIGAGPA